MLRNIALAAVLAVAVAGCSTTTPAERLAANQGTCVGYGFKVGTDAYATCMMQMDIEDKADDRRRRVAVGNALSQLGQSMQQPRAVTCSSFGNVQRTGYGAYGSSTTTCR
jgi:hypothetical protein